MVSSVLVRCSWANSDCLSAHYHDSEWGVPMHKDRKLFEMLTLEGAQAGLSWITVLKKRENYRQAFDNFDEGKIARYNQETVNYLLSNKGIIRNRLKITGTIRNAQAFLRIQDEFGTFDAYIWQFVDGVPKINTWQVASQVPTKTAESDAMRTDLKKRGFTFVGSTICYAFMQATGMVNDHLTNCFRHQQVLSEER